ncbi:hypothetical protein SAMN05444161_0014 [Rhizobiales bacterium GAS191]|nr:hypothetical protein SAMN05444161_0014 [Rhizobiales bacterium GAS191]
MPANGDGRAADDPGRLAQEHFNRRTEFVELVKAKIARLKAAQEPAPGKSTKPDSDDVGDGNDGDDLP